MSKMKDLSYDIQEMFIDGMSPATISTVLELEIEQVLSVLETFGVDVADLQHKEEFDPYNTINS